MDVRFSLSFFAALACCLLLAQKPVCAQCEVLDLHGPTVWQEGNLYGCSVDLAGGRLALGQYHGPYDYVTGGSPGSVYLFRRESSGWVPDGVVQASDGEAYADFGWSVALDGDRLLVGARTDGWLNVKGAVYVFERQGDGVWLETAKLVPDEPQALTVGWSVDLEGDTAIVGAKGASLGLGWGRVFWYEHVGGAWVLQQEILPSFSDLDGFGVSVALQGDRLVVGADYQALASSPHEGAAFVFEKQGGVWVETAALTPDDLDDGDLFGTDVALDGGTILVGAPGYDVGAATNAGAVYCFELDSGTWTLAQTIPGTGIALTYFGWSLDLVGSRCVVGAYSDDAFAHNAGSASFFEEIAGVWTEVSKFGGSEIVEDNNFGFSVDLEGSEILIGAPSVTGGTSPGAVYLFSLDPGPHLLGDCASVSLSQGGAQTLALGACSAHAGDLFFLAGSATGTTPGFAFAGLAVPLNPDVYFFHTVNHVGAPPLAGAFGTFDAFGRGEASFALPAGSWPALAGLTLQHAYAVLDGATLQPEAVSPAVPVTLVP